MKKQPNSRMCFACGLQNPVGLRITFHECPEAKQVRAEFVLPDDYQGYPGVAHGGIVAAVLDELAVRAVLVDRSHDELMTTLRLDIRYRRPTPTESPLIGVGWVKHLGGAGARTAAEIRLPDGTVTADCQAVLSRLPEALRSGWAEEMRYWKVYEDETTEG